MIFALGPSSNVSQITPSFDFFFSVVAEVLAVFCSFAFGSLFVFWLFSVWSTFVFVSWLAFACSLFVFASWFVGICSPLVLVSWFVFACTLFALTSWLPFVSWALFVFASGWFSAWLLFAVVSWLASSDVVLVVFHTFSVFATWVCGFSDTTSAACFLLVKNLVKTAIIITKINADIAVIITFDILISL